MPPTLEMNDVRPDARRLLRRAEEMISAGRPGAGRPLLEALDRMGEEAVAVADLRARMAIQDGRLADAAAVLDAALAANIGEAPLHRRRAEVRGLMEQYGDAARDAAEAVLLDPSDPTARALLGAILLQLGHLEEACSCLVDAVTRAPANPSFRQALADAQERRGDRDQAERTLTDGIALAPRAASLRTRLALARARREDWPGVLAASDAARRDGACDATLFGLRGRALSRLGRPSDAADAFADALKLDPEDACMRHLVAASGAIACRGRAPAEFVRATFDERAARFEAEALAMDVRTPGLLRAAAEADAPVSGGPALDLGCGTGLAGVALRGTATGWLVGVDVSAAMIALAAPRGVYDEMHVADMTDFLAVEARRFALVTAADALCWFGALGQLLGLVRDRLREAGLFVFSLERAPDAPEAGWRLTSSGRYVHSRAYVEAEAARAGLETVSIAREILRIEQGRPVEGLIVSLRRGGDAR